MYFTFVTFTHAVNRSAKQCYYWHAVIVGTNFVITGRDLEGLRLQNQQPNSQR